ncbi:MAG: Abi family protein, partial [Gammaproteobacteria bacterium]|nr:Abi family protein [Gammaproteobacteria bacterium]
VLAITLSLNDGSYLVTCLIRYSRTTPSELVQFRGDNFPETGGTEPFGKTWTRKNEKGLTPKLIFENEISRIINRKNPEDFIKNYKKNYLPESPPSWMLLECLPLGSIAAIFKHLGNMKDKKEIAKSFKEPATILDSWFESIRYTRNLCAHHSRLWNQWFVIEPKVSKSMGQIKTKERSFHQQAMILHKLNRALSPKSSWHNKLRELFENYSEFVPFEQMGFIEDWKKDEFWSL